MGQRVKRPVKPLGYANFTKVIFRPIERLKFIGSWFPEKSSKFYSVLSRENNALSCSLGVSPLQYSEARFSKVPTTFRARKALLCLPCLQEIKDSIMLKMTK